MTYRQSGIRQSTLTPTLSYNSLNASIDPTAGQSLTLGASLSGGLLGGEVNTIQVGDACRVALPQNSNRRTIAPGVIKRYTVEDAAVSSDIYTQIGGDTQLVANFEYRRALPGPVSLAAFFDIGSVFNLQSLEDQVSQSEFVRQSLTTYGVTLNPRGQLALPAEITAATTPETESSALPAGFRSAFLTGERSDTVYYYLSQASSTFGASYRASLGTELRVQVPVINVPFRLIFAYNPNARTGADFGQSYQEKRFAFRFSIGRTF